MKKKLLSLLCILFLSLPAISQELSYGIKGGINYPMAGTITGNSSGGNYAFTESDVSEGEGQLGFHGGLFAQVNFGKFFIRPEVVYTSLETEFDFFELTNSYTVEKLDIPLLFGYNVWGPLDVFLGPVYTNIMDVNMENNDENTPFADPLVVQENPWNAQIGVKAEFGRFGIDLRYERTMSNAEPVTLDFIDGGRRILNLAEFNDPRLHQIILGVIFKIGGPGLNQGNKPCY